MTVDTKFWETLGDINIITPFAAINQLRIGGDSESTSGTSMAMWIDLNSEKPRTPRTPRAPKATKPKMLNFENHGTYEIHQPKGTLQSEMKPSLNDTFVMRKNARTYSRMDSFSGKNLMSTLRRMMCTDFR